MFSILKKMELAINQRVSGQKPNLYVFLAFPIILSFLITFSASRAFSHIFPQFYIQWAPGLRVHHFTYGFFVLAAAGYLALVFSGPKAKYYISFLLGIGLGLAFDEFGMWLKLRDDEPTRLSYDGFTIIALSFLTILLAKPGFQTLRRLIFFRRMGNPQRP